MRRWHRIVVLAGALAILGAACSSSGPSQSPSSGPSQSSTSSAEATIKANWVAFFSGNTSAQQKVKLLQNGQRFAALIQAQAGSAIAQSAVARVRSVTIHGSRATVKYDILLAGQPAPPNQTGTANLVNGGGEGGDQSFCALLSLQGKPPPQCKTAGG